MIADHIYLRRMNLDGSNYRSLLTYYYIHSVDFDYRYYVQLVLHSVLITQLSFILILCRRKYAFWSDTSNDRIIRSYLNTTQRITLVSGRMSCVCKSHCL